MKARGILITVSRYFSRKRSLTGFISPFLTTKGKERAGFTVVELIIALSILIIIGTMTAVIFRSTQQSFINAKAFQHVIDLARQTVIRIHDELQATFIDVSGLVPFVGIDATGERIKADTQEDEIFFITPDISSPVGDICEIGYWQRNDGNFMRHFECPPDFDFLTTGGGDNELGLIINELNFQYYDGEVFLDSWDSRNGGAQEGKFPQAVKFSFYVSDEGNLIRKKFESFVQIASRGR